MKPLAAAFLPVLVVGGCSPPPSGEAELSRQDAILGGTPSPAKQNAVVLVNGPTPVWLTGVIVAPTLVLTARHGVAVATRSKPYQHCSDRLSGTAIDHVGDPSDYSIQVGDRYPFPRDAWFNVERIFSSGKLDVCQDDVVLLKVDRPFSIEPMPLRLAPGESMLHPKAGDTGTLVGWGQTEDALQREIAGKRLHGSRQQIPLTIGAVGPQDLSIGDEAFVDVLPSMFVTERVPGKGACLGDSGGPFISDESGAVWGLLSILELGPDAPPEEEPTAHVCPDSYAVFRLLSDREYDWLEGAFAEAGEAPWYEGYAKPGAVGEPCSLDQECQSRRCLRSRTASFCTKPCSMDECPTDMQCVGPSADAWCVPTKVASESTSSQGCSAPPTKASSSAAGFTSLVVLGTVVRRKRRTRTLRPSGGKS